jgi:hypothetical protein
MAGSEFVADAVRPLLSLKAANDRRVASSSGASCSKMLDDDAVEVWTHDERRFQYVSMYLVQEDAWAHEVSEIDGDTFASIVIPDATPDDEKFTPDAGAAEFRSADGTLPWSVVARLIEEASAAGDLGEVTRERSRE